MPAQVQDNGLVNIVAAWHAYASRCKYLGWGTSSGQGVSANDLAAAAPESRTDGTTSVQTVNTSNDTMRIVGSITATATRAITEVGAFDAASSGNMGLYASFTVVNLETDDSITFTLNATVDQPA